MEHDQERVSVIEGRPAKALVSDALKRRKPRESYVNGWIDRLAEKIGVSYGTVENWYYGDVAPSADGLRALIKRFGAAFANEVLAGTGVHCSGGELADVARPTSSQHASTLRAIADLIENGDAK